MRQRRWVAISAALAAMLVFVAIVATVTLRLRSSLREQIVGRDAAVLHSVVLLELRQAELSDFQDIALQEDLLGAIIEVAQLDSVIALRLFEPSGEFFDAAPSSFIRGDLSASDLQAMVRLEPVSRYHPEADLSQFFYVPGAAAGRVPLLEVLVPVHKGGSSELMGVAHFLLNGEAIRQSFEDLDGNLARQALLALLAGLLIGGGLLAWAFGRLQRANALLLRRSQELSEANRELLRSAKTSAIGAVTAHLVHALKNPLASLQLFVEMRRETDGAGDEALDSAGDAARRMQHMIHDAVAVLQQEEVSERFDFTLDEIGQIVIERCRGEAGLRGVNIVQDPAPALELDNRRGNLLTLSAINLAQNAVQASPNGGRVRLSWQKDGGSIILQVEDEGPGLPEEMLSDPFKPGRSGKAGGSGLGLSISRQLVRHIGGDIQLVRTGPGGTVFAITLPIG